MRMGACAYRSFGDYRQIALLDLVSEGSGTDICVIDPILLVGEAQFACVVQLLLRNRNRECSSTVQYGCFYITKIKGLV